MKKKAPCGKIDRDDLPWCCHRRLGEWLPRLQAAPGDVDMPVILAGAQSQLLVATTPGV